MCGGGGGVGENELLGRKKKKEKKKKKKKKRAANFAHNAIYCKEGLTEVSVHSTFVHTFSKQKGYFVFFVCFCFCFVI